MAQKRKQKTTWNREKKRFAYSNFLGILLLLIVPSYFIYELAQGQIRIRLLESSGIVAQAVVIDDKNYWGNSPVSHTFSYSYLFEIAGKEYVGDTHNIKCYPGQIVKIEYVPSYPGFNRMVEAK